MNSTNPSNALEIEAGRAKNICDRVLSSQIEQGIKNLSPDVMEIVNTLQALGDLNFWSSSVAFWASQYSRPKCDLTLEGIPLELAKVSLLENLEFCQPQLAKYGSVEGFLTYAETLIQ